MADGQPDFFYVASIRRSGLAGIDLTLNLDTIWSEIERITWREFPSLEQFASTTQRFVGVAPPCDIPLPLKPFVPTPEPAWYPLPPKPDRPQLLPDLPLDVVEFDLLLPVLPDKPVKYVAAPLPPIALPKPPTFIARRRGIPQIMAAIASFMGVALLVIGGGAGSGTLIALGVIYAAVFGVWWLVCELERPRSWRRDLEERTNDWRIAVRAIESRRQVELLLRETAQQEENNRRLARWEAEVARLCAAADEGNERRKSLVNQENAKRRQAWAIRNQPIENENQNRLDAWKRSVDEWEKLCVQLRAKNETLRAKWTEQNRPMRDAWEAAERNRKERIGILRQEFEKRRRLVYEIDQKAVIARSKWQQAIDQGIRRFDTTKTTLKDATNDAKSIRLQYQTELQEKINATVPAQRQQFLRAFLISESGIPKFGDTLYAELTSRGIETAADIDTLLAVSIRGFGPKRKTSLRRWRDELLRKFRHNPNSFSSTPEAARLVAKYAPRLNHLQQQLRQGPSDLQGVITSTQRHLEVIWKDFSNCINELAQSKADLSVVEDALRQCGA